MHDPINDEWHVWPDADSQGNMKNLYLHICFSTGTLHEGPCLCHNVADQALTLYSLITVMEYVVVLLSR